jgi:hypothetical protein
MSNNINEQPTTHQDPPREGHNMSINVNTENIEEPDMKTVDLDTLTGPEILVPEGGIYLPATHRCDRCGVQAWVEVEQAFTRTVAHLNTDNLVGSGQAMLAEAVVSDTDSITVLLCAHHYRENEDSIKSSAKRIVDYRPTLEAQEKAGGPAL